MMLVMGIDPGVASTGFGVVRVAGAEMSAVDAGVIRAPRDEPAAGRLARIHDAVAELLSLHQPSALALEDVYFGRNARSAIAVGQARGVALLAAGQRGIACFDYTPQAVKMSVCGSGSATKDQVQRMVGALLGMTQAPESDHAADALAAAICHAGHAGSVRALGDRGREVHAG
jgi:crossover junction endodeoxyribonuclease RuvC